MSARQLRTHCIITDAVSLYYQQSNLTWAPWILLTDSKKMVLDTFLLNTQQYKVRIKDKVEQSRERSSALPYTSV